MSQETIVTTVRRFYPETQAVYHFGSYLTPDETKKSDADIAILLLPGPAKRVGGLAMSECRASLEDALKRDVDLVNLRMVNTVFQKEVIENSRLIFKRDEYAVDEFEMQVLSAYQKLNEERAGILEDIFTSGSILR
jgi:predicted nucleotidyltransferase